MTRLSLPSSAAITEAMLDAEELAAEQADSPPLEVDGVLDMT